MLQPGAWFVHCSRDSPITCCAWNAVATAARAVRYGERPSSADGRALRVDAPSMRQLCRCSHGGRLRRELCKPISLRRASAAADAASGAPLAPPPLLRRPPTECFGTGAQAEDARRAWAAEAAAALPSVDLRVLPPPPLSYAAASLGEQPTPPLVVLLGTRHDCEATATDVAAAIAALHPDDVGLELCARRFRRLFPFGVGAFAGLSEAERARAQGKLRFGKEQLAAALAAHTVRARVALCDRDVRVTEARFLSAMPPDVLLAGSLIALGAPSLAAFAAWLCIARALRRRCLCSPSAASGGDKGVGAGGGVLTGLDLGLGSLPADLLERLAADADRFAADGSLSPSERWKRMQAAIDGVAAADAGAGLKAATESALDEAATAHVIRERDELLLLRLRRQPGPLVMGVVGVAHVAGMERAASEQHSAAVAGQAEAALLERPRLPWWRALVGRPLLWRLHEVVDGSFANFTSEPLAGRLHEVVEGSFVNLTRKVGSRAGDLPQWHPLQLYRQYLSPPAPASSEVLAVPGSLDARGPHFWDDLKVLLIAQLFAMCCCWRRAYAQTQR